MKATVQMRNNRRFVSFEDMRPGQIAWWGGCGRNRILVLRTYQGIVDLNDPRKTWESVVSTGDEFELLPRGTVVSLEVED